MHPTSKPGDLAQAEKNRENKNELSAAVISINYDILVLVFIFNSLPSIIRITISDDIPLPGSRFQQLASSSRRS